MPPTENVDAAKIQIVVSTPDNAKPAPGQKQVLGNGWYANVEVDQLGRVHLAWTHADVGDVMYALVNAAGQVGKPEPVEVMGAVGTYLQLAIGAGNVPVLTYFHQTERTLRMAHRDADLELMKAAGAEVAMEGAPPSRNIPGERPDPPDRMGAGWIGEDITFGDNVGLASSVTVDAKGYPHVAYYSRGERMRYARRRPGTPAFGPPVRGQWELLDVDVQAGASFSMRTDILALRSGEVAISFCHWNFVDAQLKVGILKPGAKTFIVAASVMNKEGDGWSSSMVERKDGKIDVFSVASSDKVIKHAIVDPAEPQIAAKRPSIMDRPGPTVVQMAKDGTVWVLTRGVGMDSIGETTGIWLAKIPNGDGSKIQRWVLDPGFTSDPWLDLALLPDGTPVAVWTTVDHRAMKLYFHRGP